MLAGAFGVLICGMLIGVFVYSEKPDTSRSSVVLLAPETQPGPETLAAAQAGTNPLLRAAGDDVSSTAGAASLGSPGSLFEEIGKPTVQPVAFAVPGGN
jgi:hypothetical protein